ncbi:MAG: S-layer homology domain-containing protein, partial [Clostridia bacterium]|nr:S-layer homology domain-containing protein [Clostridia bacterium]
MKKKLMAVLLALTMVITLLPTALAAGSLPFKDVADDFWAEEEISWAYEEGLMNGTTDTTFNPGGKVTRQQVWMILARMSGASPANMAEAKAWAVSAGISDGSVPGGAVTRQQLAAMLYRYEQSLGGGFTGLWAFP